MHRHAGVYSVMHGARLLLLCGPTGIAAVGRMPAVLPPAGGAGTRMMRNVLHVHENQRPRSI